MSSSGEIMFYTSGSTGTSKTIVKTVSSLDADAAMLVSSFPDLFADKPYVVATIRPEHMFGALWKERVPCLAGCQVHKETVFSVEELVAATQSKQKVLLLTTPSFLDKAVQTEEFKLLKNVFSGIVTSGSLLKQDLAMRVFAYLGVAVTEIFGSTETGSVAWRRRSEGDEWRLFQGVQARTVEGGVLEVDSEFCVYKPFVMGDAVEFTGENTFKLLGRVDRNVKILERYVSLPAIEAALESHHFVAKAHVIASDEAVPRVRALIELTSEGKQQLKKTSYSAIAGELKKIKAIESFAFPRRIRFVNHFNYNEQGKLPRSIVAPILESRYQEPVSENENFSASCYSADLTFIPDAFYFNGHFSSFKILPGVVQLDYIERCIRRKWGRGSFSGEISRLKFQRPIQPRENVHLEIVKKDDSRFSFVINCSDSICTSGELRYCNTINKVSLVASKLFVAAVSFFVMVFSLFAGPREQFESALRRALTSSASWTMVKTMEGSPVKLSSSGTVECVPKEGIVWQIKKPFKSSISMKSAEMCFCGAGGNRTVPASKMPHYEDITKAIDDFSLGKAAGFGKIFEIDAEDVQDGTWKVVLVPKRRDMRRILKMVELKGSKTLEDAILHLSSGERAAYSFEEILNQMPKKGGE